ncbi:MAG: hypothetical protein GY835_15105 [bacterium]|nr:hypothetical protein [bacterium]
MSTSLNQHSPDDAGQGNSRNRGSLRDLIVTILQSTLLFLVMALWCGGSIRYISLNAPSISWFTLLGEDSLWTEAIRISDSEGMSHLNNSITVS